MSLTLTSPAQTVQVVVTLQLHWTQNSREVPEKQVKNTDIEKLPCPGAPLTYFNDGGCGGGLTEVHILYPKKSQLQNLSTPKNPYFF